MDRFVKEYGSLEIPQLKSSEDIALSLVASVINKAQEKIGVRQNLFEIAKSRLNLSIPARIRLIGLKPPLVLNCEKLIRETVEKSWRLTETLGYHVVYLGSSEDVCSQYYYHEVIFSQPTVAYPIPQATVSVLFRLQYSHAESADAKELPTLIFRIEGHHTEHDVRYVRLCVDWILAVLQMKIKFFQRLEKIRMF